MSRQEPLRRKYIERGHVDAVERPLVQEMQDARAAGDDTYANEILDTLLKAYWHHVLEMADRLEQQGYNRDDVESAAAMRLVYLIGSYDASKNKGLHNWISFYVTDSQILNCMPNLATKQKDPQTGRTGLSSRFWGKVIDERSTVDAGYIEARADVRVSLPERDEILLRGSLGSEDRKLSTVLFSVSSARFGGQF